MSRLIKVQRIEERSFAGEIQIELTWEKPVVARLDFGGLARGFKFGSLSVSTTTSTELRQYPTEYAAQSALARLQQEVRPCRTP